MGPNRNAQSKTAKIILIRERNNLVLLEDYDKDWIKHNEVHVKTLIMPIVAADALSVAFS